MSDGLDRAREAVRARVEAGLGARKDPLERAAEQPTSLRAAVTAKCFDCVGGDADPCWQWRVGNCACPSCPLYPVRPHRRHEGLATPTSLM